MIVIDYKDRRPIYEQVIEKFEELIIQGVLKPNDAMQSVRSLAMELSINPNTIQRAYQELERSGFIYTVKGKGSFVSDSPVAMQQKKEFVKGELRINIRKALELGMREDEFQMIVSECYKELIGDSDEEERV